MIQIRLYFFLLFIGISNTVFNQVLSRIGDVNASEYGTAITADANNNVFFSYTSAGKVGIIKQNATQNILWNKKIEFSSNNEIDITYIDIIGDTLFGCGWLKNGNAILGTHFFKMNSNTGAIYWAKSENTSLSYFSSMSYANGKYFLSGARVGDASGNDYSIKVIAVSSSDGSVIWQSQNLGLKFSGYNIDYIDDVYGASEMKNGKMFLIGRSYVNGSDNRKMRSILIGVSESGTFFMAKYLLSNIKTEVDRRYYGMKISYDGDDSLIITQSGFNSSIEVIKDCKVGLIKVDTAGKVAWAKTYNIQGATSQYSKGLHVTNNGYSIFSQYTDQASNSRMCVINTDKNGIPLVSSFLFTGNSPLTLAQNTYLSVGGASKYINGNSYYTGSTFDALNSQKDIMVIGYNNNLNVNQDCYSISKAIINYTNLQPYSENLIKLFFNNPISYQTTFSSSDVIFQDRCANIKLNIKQNILCNNTDLNVSLSGVIDPLTTFLWSNGATSNSLNVQTTTKLFVQAKIPSLCCTIKDSVTPNILLTSKIKLVLPKDTSICKNSSISLTPIVSNTNGNYTLLWQDNSTTMNHIADLSGIYWCEAKDNCGTSRDSVVINIIVPPTINIDTIFQICSNKLPYELSPIVNNASNIFWEDNSTLLNRYVSDFGDYSLTAMNQCSQVTKKIKISEYEMPFLNLNFDSSDCSPFVLKLPESIMSLSNFFRIDTGNGEFNSLKKELKFSEPGEYKVKFLYNNNGCVLLYNKTITVWELPIAKFDTVSSVNSSFENIYSFINSSENATNYRWNFGDYSPISKIINPTHIYDATINNTIVKLTAFNINGCRDSAYMKIIFYEEPLIYIPNTFTPNGDERNNVFVPIIFSGIDEKDFTFYIWNRWGELIFESHNYNIGWDGTYANNIVLNGTYIWKIMYKPTNTKKYHSKRELVGHVNVVY